MENIRLFVMDVDGTLTDGKIYMSNTGEIFKVFSVKDGYAIKNMLPQMNILPVIITGRSSKILELRCMELSVKFLYQNIQNKVDILDKLLKELKLTFSNVAYIGDDLNDLECMKLAAIRGCPNDAAPEIVELSDFISVKNGGAGAVRDFVEWLQNN